MSSIQSDPTGDTDLDIRIDTDVLQALSGDSERSETEPKICRWLDCLRR